jgi:murein DD-endopeptidase MepM/ murein hydrolase activator NlpD
MMINRQRFGRSSGRRTRTMAYREKEPAWSRRQAALLSAIAALILLAVVGVSGMFGRGADGSVAATPSPLLSARRTPSTDGPAATIAQRSTPPPTDPTPSGRPTPTRRPPSVPTATPSATATPAPGGAPRSHADFDLRRQVIDIGFPLRRQTRYHYRDNYLDRREGPPNEYNHVRMGRDGETIRLHDGIDIYAREGAPVVSPFDGVVIDPRAEWAPWVPERYGRTVAIVSEEPQRAGYTAILVHLDERWVDVGQQVSRGQVIGVLGSTGNAEGGQPHLHFELRAPFLIDWSPLGEERLVDAFNPFRSLRRADPHR